MKMPKTKKNNLGGVVLITVVMVMCVTFILIAAIIGFVNQNVNQTLSNYQREQAFLTASSYLKSFVADIEKSTTVADSDDSDAKDRRQNYIDNLKKLAEANGGKGTTTTDLNIDGKNVSEYNMGTVTMKVANGSSSGELVITATCRYMGKEEQIAAHMIVDSATIPGQYQNAIEIVGTSNQKLGNLRTIGSYARINPDLGSSVVYETENNCSTAGGMFLYGSLKVVTQSKFELLNNYNKNEQGGYDGSSFVVTQDLIVTNGNVFEIISRVPASDSAGYMNVGNKILLEGPNAKIGSDTTEKLRVFCKEFVNKSNDSVIYGNVYVRKDGTGNGGNAEISVTNSKIYGDLFVEGDLKVSGNVTVDGNVYVGGNVTGTINFTGTDASGANHKLIKQSASNAAYTTAVNAAPKTPEIKATMNEYLYKPEYMLAGGDQENFKGLTNTYKSFYNDASVGARTLDQLAYASVSTGGASKTATTADGANVTANFYAEIKQSCTLTENSIKAPTFCNNNKGKKFLITVKNEDIVIRVPNLNLGDNQYKTMFVVKNESGVNSKTGGMNHACYFVSDSGLGGSNVTQKDSEGDVEYKTRTGMSKVDVKVDGWCIMDFDTYVNVWDRSDLTKSDFNGFQTNGNVVLNTTDQDTTKFPTLNTGEYYYTPNKGNIHVLLTKGSTWTNTNNGFYECEFYMPDADFHMKTQGAVTLRCIDSTGSQAGIHGTYSSIINIGMVVANTVDSANTSVFVFNQPDPNSIWGPLKGKNDLNLSAWKLDRYDYY